jgi:nucleotide-binding universal stress UspA family protein
VQPWPEGTPLSILVALDGSTLAERVLAPVQTLASVLNAEILLVQVVDGLVRFPGSPEAIYLDDIANTLRGQGVVVRTRLATGHPSVAIGRVAREEGVNLIAMATHGRAGLARLAFGSVATATLQRADVPLLMVSSASEARAVSVTAPANIRAGTAAPMSSPMTKTRASRSIS